MRKLWIVFFLIVLLGIPLIGKTDIVNRGMISYCNLAGENTTELVSDSVMGIEIFNTGTIEIQNITLSAQTVPANSIDSRTITVTLINHSRDTFTLQKSSLNFYVEDKEVTSEYSFDTPPSFSVVSAGTEECSWTITRTGPLNGEIKIKVNLELDTGTGNNIFLSGWTEITAYTEKTRNIIIAEKNTQGETLASLYIPALNLEKDAIIILTSTIADASLKEQIARANNSAFNNLGYSRDQGLNNTIWQSKAVDINDTSASVGVENTATIRITISYKGTTFLNPATEDSLKIYKLQGNSWVVVPNEQIINKEKKTVSVIVNSLGVYRILGLRVAATDLKNVIVFPNPYNPSLAHNKELKFINLTENVQIYIYNLAGEKVWEKTIIDNNSGEVHWDGCNEQGEKVASGIYFYFIINTKDPNDKTSGKIGLVR